MPRRRSAVVSHALRLAAAALALATPTLAVAHSFGRMYNLPVPFWMYIYGASAALLLSFVIVGWFMTAPRTASPTTAAAPARTWRLPPRLLQALQLLALACLLLTLATGFLGNRDPYRNFSMTFFWVVFLLGYAYLTALAGDSYSHINPWRTIARGIGRVWADYPRGRLRYPERLGYWPALLLYMGFIWIELFSYNRPLPLALLLSAYAVITLAGIGLFGLAAWLRFGDFFGVFLRLTGRMAPLAWEDGRLRWRRPFAGLLEEPAESLSLLLFILFMLSSTAYDGLRATLPWLRLFWSDPWNLLTPWLGRAPLYAYAELRPWYLVWESAWLLLSPFIYLAVYLLFIALARAMAGSRLSLRALALRFAHSLLPIALVYNITHYYTLLLTQGVKIVSLLSDPFGRGWNLFGTAGWWRAPILPDMGWVWHSQVGLILFGHVVSVVIAHQEALRCFPTRRQALLSQLPMLLLMVLFTGFGLWILAQPIQSGA